MSDSTDKSNIKRRPTVAVVGNSKVERGSAKDALSESIGKALVDNGYRVMTGGLGGVMAAACRGAKLSTSYTPGDTIGILPGHAADDANEFIDIAIPTGLDHVRNSVVAHADAVIAIGGGAGTMSEICLAWVHKRLIISMRIDGWSHRMADQPVDSRIRYPEIPDDRVYGASDAEEAVDLIKRLLPAYQKQHRLIPATIKKYTYRSEI